MFSNPNIRRLALARLISSAGGEAAFFVGIWGRAAFEFDATPTEIAVMMAVMGLTMLAGTAAAGVLVDRFGPRRVLIGAEIFFAPAALALILPSSMVTLTMVVGIVGTVGGIVYTAVGTFPPYLTDDPELLGKTNAAMETASTGAFIAGPALGAALASTVGLNWIFVLDSATSVVGLLLILGVSTRATVQREHASALAEVREGVQFAYRQPRVRFVLLLGVMIWVSFGAFSALEPIFFREVVQTGPAALGVVNSIFGAGMALGATLMGRYSRRLLTMRVATVLTVAAGLGAIAYAGTGVLAVVAVGGFAWGLVLGMLLPVLRTLLQAVTPPHLQGRAISVWQAHNTVGEMLPLLIVPGLAAAFGVQAVLVGAGVLVVLGGFAFLPSAGTIDRRGVFIPADLLDTSVAAPKHPVEPSIAADLAVDVAEPHPTP
jgi:MFS transporter, DHA3 family, macrolide efflux protein